MNPRIITGWIVACLLGAGLGIGGAYFALARGWVVAVGGDVAADGAQDHADAHDERDAHGEDEDHDEAQVVRLSEAVMREFGVEVATAGPGELRETLALPGEVQANQDRLAHIVPRVSGIVREVHVGLGEDVEAGQLMAVLESRELAEAKAAYLAARQRLSLAEANLSANEELHARGVVSDLDFLQARRELADAEIGLRAAQRRLHALGLSEQEIAAVESEPLERFAIYSVRAPFGGTVIEKHITLGEVVGPDSDVYVLADLRDVWVMLTVYQKDLPRVAVGQRVLVRANEGGRTAEGRIDYVSPTVDESTRTATARVVIDNTGRLWRPGLFVTGQVEVGQREVPVAVPLSALQELDGRTCVFVLTDGGFVPQPVTLGRSDGRLAEVLEGLRPGQRYAARGAFTLKAELLKAGFAGAGHAH